MPDAGGRALPPRAIPRLWAFALAAAGVLVALALLRPVDHDESQYVAAAALTARGLLPFRDYAYLQTPLQPFLVAPLVTLTGAWAWPVLRIANAVFAAAAVTAVAGAARARGASARAALVAAGLFAATDILLFSAGTARNDALPAALLSIALWLASRDEVPGRNGRSHAALVGLLLAGAAAAKLSYALPAGAYWLTAVVDRRRRPVAVAIGAVPVLAFLAWTAWESPAGFLFGTLRFPVEAPAEYYRASGRAWRLSTAAKTLDALKFLALGPALLACVSVAAQRWRHRPAMLDALILAGLLAAVLPSPTWRQYWLPMMPPLFIALALTWTRRPPGRPEGIAAVVFACAGLAPSVAALTSGPGLVAGMREGRAIGRTLDQAGLGDAVPIATLSPQFLPAAGRLPDPRFAAGPFYFRSAQLLTGEEEARLHLVSRARLPMEGPAAVLVGGEDRWSAGDPALDLAMARWAAARGLRRVDVPGTRFHLFLR